MYLCVCVCVCVLECVGLTVSMPRSDMFSGEDGSEFSGSDFNSTMDSSGSRLDDIMNDDFL